MGCVRTSQRIDSLYWWVCHRISGITVTTTSISSRERPRPRTAGQVGGYRECSSATSSPVPTRHAGKQQSANHGAGAKPRPVSTFMTFDAPQPSQSDRLPASGNNSGNFLGVSEQLTDRAATKSWDSGLDMFGAVPFSGSTSSQVQNTLVQHVR